MRNTIRVGRDVPRSWRRVANDARERARWNWHAIGFLVAWLAMILLGGGCEDPVGPRTSRVFGPDGRELIGFEVSRIKDADGFDLYPTHPGVVVYLIPSDFHR